MAYLAIFATLLIFLAVFHLPVSLSADSNSKAAASISDIVEGIHYQECYVDCLKAHRFPCRKGSLQCGDCMSPIYNEDGCEEIEGNEVEKRALLNLIRKRDQGTDGIEVDTGGEQPQIENDEPSLTGPKDDPSLTENDAPASLVQSQNSEVIEEQQPQEGSVILLAEWQFILIVCGCVAIAIVGVAIAVICWYKIQTTSKAQNEADYPAYGVTGPGTQVSTTMNNGDRKLAQSAQMYHYQHQKQQMIAMEKREKGEVQRDASDYDSEEENEDGDLTVYECPGLAPTGEMQVKNPLFAEDAYPKPPEDEDEEKQ